MKRMLALLIGLTALIGCDTRTGTPIPKPNSVKSTQPTLTQNPYAPLDLSPIDVTYFPVDYPTSSSSPSKNKPYARIFYSRPHLQGRHIFHEVVPAGQPWRLGANEATELELFQPATIQNQRIEAGRYTLYAIPEENQWTLILNKKIHNWGLDIDPKQDVARFTLPVEKPEAQLEYFTMTFLGKDQEATLLIGWDNSLVKLPLQFDR